MRTKLDINHPYKRWLISKILQESKLKLNNLEENEKVMNTLNDEIDCFFLKDPHQCIFFKDFIDQLVKIADEVIKKINTQKCSV
ncbi:MAG: hypothetical protein KGI58_02195 [Patescibacteria group bacterium]|nr:hypothetical protein [Patescibacteria group bacterium]